MTTQDRLNKISALVAEREKKARLEEMEKQKLLDLIASYADRIKDMLLIANTLHFNDISVSRFEASRNAHKLGFIRCEDDEYPNCYYAIGVLKQEYSDLALTVRVVIPEMTYYPEKHEDVIINEKGIAIKFDTIWDCESWTKDFEMFENDFYYFVDNELK